MWSRQASIGSSGSEVFGRDALGVAFGVETQRREIEHGRINDHIILVNVFAGAHQVGIALGDAAVVERPPRLNKLGRPDLID